MRELQGFYLPFFSCKSQFPRLLVQSWDGKLSLSVEGIQGMGLLCQLRTVSLRSTGQSKCHTDPLLFYFLGRDFFRDCQVLSMVFV